MINELLKRHFFIEQRARQAGKTHLLKNAIKEAAKNNPTQQYVIYCISYNYAQQMEHEINLPNVKCLSYAQTEVLRGYMPPPIVMYDNSALNHIFKEAMEKLYDQEVKLKKIKNQISSLAKDLE